MKKTIAGNNDVSFFQKNIVITISLTFACYIAVNYGMAIDLFSMIVSDMKNDLGFDYTVVGTIAAFTRGGFLVASLLSILIVPVIGTGPLMIWSVVVCVACFWGMVFASNIWLIGALMTLIGACAATVYIPMVGLVSKFIPFKYHGRVLGFICGGQSLGVFIASLMVPFFITNQTWRSAWIAVGVIGILAILCTYPVLKNIGVCTSTPNEDDAPESVFQIFGGLGSVLSRATMLVLILYFLSAFACNPFQTYLSSYLREELGFSVDMAATIWSCMAIPGIASGLIMGYLADRLGIRFSLVVSYISIFAASLVLVFPIHPSLFIPSGLLFGLAYYSIFGLIPAYISKTNSPATGIKVFALANIIHGFGGISGNFIGGWFKEISGSFQILYILISSASLLLIFFTLFLPEEQENSEIETDTFAQSYLKEEPL